jgi:UrcA family protein
MTKFALIALACSASLSTAAFAADDIAVLASGDTHSAKVNIADLNLTEARGKVLLRARMKQAVQAICAADAACNYTAERDSARLASNAIAAASGTMASAAPTHLTISSAH